MSEADIRTRLEAAGARYAEADRAREDALAELAAVMQSARDEVPIAQMARLGNVSRVTVYRLLEK
ncbi:hypothetical protein [Nocardioides alcanivorans]|uniref:hypothetical protein n=1 Tax=Nocardioides alcanivorans TaxID=2897352 RepID=UPI001F387423|nr:hypothetical protein [Nocardioides alcanivorans]